MLLCVFGRYLLDLSIKCTTYCSFLRLSFILFFKNYIRNYTSKLNKYDNNNNNDEQFVYHFVGEKKYCVRLSISTAKREELFFFII